MLTYSKKLVMSELQRLPIKKVYESIDLRKGLESLEGRTDTVIRPADKGGGIVVLSLEQYKAEMNRILNDEDTYQPLNADPSKLHKERLELIVQQGMENKLLSKQEAKYLVPMVSKIPVIYNVPKIHRPIVSGIESLTSRLGEYIDLHLQPLVRKTDAYLKDTKHTLQLLKRFNTNEDLIMATGDVASLYTNIDHEGALNAVKWALEKGDDLT